MRKAFSLSITMWISAIMIAIGVYFLTLSKKEVNNDKLLLDKLSAYLKVKSKLAELEYYLASGKQVYNRVENTLNGYPSFLLTDGTEYNDSGILFSIQDNGGLLHSYSLNSYEIMNLAKENNISDYLIPLNSYRDWSDRDDIALPEGAEAGWYKVNGFNYVPRNSKIFIKDELKDIRGWNEILNRYTKLMTYGIDIGYNYTAMNAEVLHIKYGIDIQEARKLIRFRKESVSKFLEEFYSIQKNNYDYESDSYFPTYVYTIFVTYVSKNIKVHKTIVIDCKKFIIRYGYF